MGPHTLLDSLVSRTVAYRYCKRSYTFDLSHALFSSAGVDGGTHLLLSLIAEELDLSRYERIVDLGSGAGTLGILLAGASDAKLLAVDRDACATAFTSRNAVGNGLIGVDSRTALVVPDEPVCGPELAVSNLPAKAGQPVLRLLVRQLAHRAAASGGESGIVIVKPLLESLTATLGDIGVTVLAERRTAGHAAVLFRCSSGCALPRALPPAGGSAALPDEFIRTRATFQGPAAAYEIDTVHNLPEFDGLSFRTALAFDLLRSASVGGDVLVYGCGQGHLPIGVSQRASKGVRLSIADRDLLAVRASERNLRANGVELASRHAVPGAVSLVDLVQPGSVAWLVLNDDPIPGSQWNQEMTSLVQRLLSPQGKVLAVSRSTSVGRFQKSAGHTLTQLSERRMHGFRATLLRRRH